MQNSFSVHSICHTICQRIDTTILTHFLYLFFSAVKAKNVVTLSVDDIFAQPGIGVPGVSSTDTSHGLFIGGT